MNQAIPHSFGAEMQRLARHLGSDALLIPVGHGLAPFRLAGFQPPTPATVATASYQLDLAEQDVAVVLGRPSDGLCALLFPPGDVVINAFMTALRVEQGETVTLLPWVEGPLPGTRRSEDVAWLSTGTSLPVIRRRPKLNATIRQP